MNHTEKPGWFYAYGYNWKQMPAKPISDLGTRAQVELHFKTLANRERAKDRRGMFCECKDCLAGLRLVNKGWRPDKS